MAQSIEHNKLSFNYTLAIESSIIRGVDSSARPWNITDEIAKFCGKNKKMLDIGCGTAFKILPLAGKVESIIGLEPIDVLIEKAESNIETSEIKNVTIVKGYADNLPFQNESFEIVTAILAPHDAAEVYRVLKPNGIAIFEKIGGEDKSNIKKLFGKDSDGWRGYFCNDDPFYWQNLYRKGLKQFSSVTITDGYWDTYYTIDQLIMLLEETPTVRRFDRISDASILNKVIEKYMTENGIKTTQNRLLITAKKSIVE